jgi:hypothetical protein
VTRSRISGTLSHLSNCRIALSAFPGLDTNTFTIDQTSSCTDSHLTTTNIPRHKGIDPGYVATHPSVEQPLHNSEETTPFGVIDGSAQKCVSLANQYLDTMIMDDAWRAACIRKIRQNRRKQRALKQLNNNTATKEVHQYSSKHPKRLSNTLSKDQLKSKVTSSKGLKKKCNKSTSPRGSDSGFVSSSPTPGPSTCLRVHSTRNYTIQSSNTTVSIDLPSMIGRSCLSCGCTNTTCWRRKLGGIICNSCGLR